LCIRNEDDGGDDDDDDECPREKEGIDSNSDTTSSVHDLLLPAITRCTAVVEWGPSSSPHWEYDDDDDEDDDDEIGELDGSPGASAVRSRIIPTKS
jgi:hypothetical protein